ncbi:hypothetical protein NA57DRAFT_54521 [Rhizodiscina lignyota]|uniref:Uncharacterized protein n=1 Tax=Rhizodiscina lignyota TaxID=1504668 RepID=A0A9P4IIV4_9PEZI|nr:hypothetical protein NA57DRAFT_54521 [Rhizodiscina lignyota]
MAHCPSSLATERPHHRPEAHDSYDDCLHAKETVPRLPQGPPLTSAVLALNQVLLEEYLADPEAVEEGKQRVQLAAKDLGFELPNGWEFHAEMARGKTPLQAWLSDPANEGLVLDRTRTRKSVNGALHDPHQGVAINLQTFAAGSTIPEPRRANSAET